MKPSAGGQGILALLVLSVAINYLDRGALSVAAPRIAAELSLSTNDLGLLLSAFFWTYAAFQIVSGWLVDRFPVKWVYAGGFLVWSLSTAAVGAVGSFGVLLGLRLLLGMGESVAYPAVSKILVRAFPEQRRGLANALVDAGARTGPALSTLLGGLAVDALGWRALFVIAGVGSLLWLIPWVLFVRIEDAPAAPGGAPAEPVPGWGELLGRRAFWGTASGMFAIGYVTYFLLSWLPSYLVTERGLTMRAMAVAGAVPFAAMGLASIAGGWSSDRCIARGWRVSPVRLSYATGGLVLCGLLLVPAAAVADQTLSLTILTLACICLGGFTSNVWAITQTLAGAPAAGRWTGLQNAIGNLGGVAAPLITARIVSATGSFFYAFLTATVVLLAGATLYLLLIGRVTPVVWNSATRSPSASA